MQNIHENRSYKNVQFDFHKLGWPSWGVRITEKNEKLFLIYSSQTKPEKETVRMNPRVRWYIHLYAQLHTSFYRRKTKTNWY